jgi:hypothetical protein
MSTQNVMVNGVDRDERGMYRLGGISALILGIFYIVIVALYVPLGVPPSGAQAWLTHLAENTTTWWVILGLSVLTDFLFVPVALSLYIALKAINRNVMLVATAFVGLFIVLDLGLTWTNYASLISLSGRYAAATNDAQKAAVVIAATYPSAILQSNLLFVYNTLTLSIGIFITGFVMLKGIFSKRTAYLGITTGILGIVAVVGPLLVSALSPAIILASILTTAWVLFAGYRLYTLSQPS